MLDERRVLLEDLRPGQRRDAGDDVEGAGDDEEQADELDPAAALAGFIIWFVAFGAFPLWSLTLFVIYGLILYGLTAYREYFR